MAVAVVAVVASVGAAGALADTTISGGPGVHGSVAVAGVADTPAAAADSVVGGTSVRTTMPRFVDAPYREHRGDVVHVPVAVTPGSSVALTVAGNGSDYATSLVLHDGNTDGLVTLAWNTYGASDGARDRTFGTKTAADSVVVGSESPADGPPAPGAYDLTVSPDGNDTGGTDSATLHLRRPGPVELSVLRAARDAAANLTTAEAVEATLATSDLSPTVPGPEEHAFVTEREVLVLSVRAPGLAGAYADAAGSNATTRFRSLLGEALSIGAQEDETTVETSEQRFAYHLREATGYRVVAHPTNDTYYLVLGDGNEVKEAASSISYDDVDLGDVFHFDASVGVARAENATANASVEFVAPDFAGLETTDRDRLPPAASNGTVVGTTSVRPGKQVTVTLDSDAGESFPVVHTVTVAPAGRFRAHFDLSGVPPGTAFEAVVRVGNRTVDSARGIVGPAARVRFDDFPAFVQHLESLPVDSVYTTDGGFLALHLESPDGPVVGVSDYVGAGNESNVAVPLQRDLDGNVTVVAVAHRDRNGDRRFDASDAPYGAGRPAVEARLVDVDGTPTATATRSPTSTATPTRTETQPGHGDVPGFGVVVALVALAVVTVARVGRSVRRGDGV